MTDFACSLFDDDILAKEILSMGIGMFEKGHGCPDGYIIGGSHHPLEYFVKSPKVAIEVIRRAIEKYWEVRPAMAADGMEYQCMVIKRMGVKRSPFVSMSLQRSIIMACVEALKEDSENG